MFPIFFLGGGYEGHWMFGTLVLGYIYQRYKSQRAGYSASWFNGAWGFSILSGIIFARVFHFLFWQTEQFFENPLIFFQGGGGGAAILGATIGTGFGGWVYSRMTRVNFLHWCDSLMAPIAICLTLSRVSCFLNGDAFGIPTGMPWGMVFSDQSIDYSVYWRELHRLYANSPMPLDVIAGIFAKWNVGLSDLPLPAGLAHLSAAGVHNLADLQRYYPGDPAQLKELGLVPFPLVLPAVHPTQLYESALNLVIFLIVYFAWGKPWARQRLFFIFWFFYGMNRFLVEFWRFDWNPATYLGIESLSYAQVISVGLVLFGAGGYIYNTVRWKRTGLPEPALR